MGVPGAWKRLGGDMTIFGSHVGPDIPNIGYLESYDGIGRYMKAYGGIGTLYIESFKRNIGAVYCVPEGLPRMGD